MKKNIKIILWISIVLSIGTMYISWNNFKRAKTYSDEFLTIETDLLIADETFVKEHWEFGLLSYRIECYLEDSKMELFLSILPLLMSISTLVLFNKFIKKEVIKK
jgi:hypothetical protein